MTTQEDTRIEVWFEVQKWDALARRYARLRKELGADVCLMLALEEAISQGQEHKLVLANHGYTTSPAVTQALTRPLASIHNTKTSLVLVEPKKKRAPRKRKGKDTANAS